MWQISKEDIAAILHQQRRAVRTPYAWAAKNIASAAATDTGLSGRWGLAVLAAEGMNAAFPAAAA
jgi:hypothetical protein